MRTLTLAVAFLVITAVGPMPVFADNGLSFVDMWPAIDIAVFAGFATPFIIWGAGKHWEPPGPWSIEKDDGFPGGWIWDSPLRSRGHPADPNQKGPPLDEVPNS